MTDKIIQEQIKDIREATEKALESKQASIAILVAAGIIKITPPQKPVITKPK